MSDVPRKILKLPPGRKDASSLDLSGGVVMGIVNCNEDSFYPPSRALGTAAVERALRLVSEGAGIVDFGAESTRPGASYISAEEELERLVPAVEGLRKRSGIPISVDTRKGEVARAVLDAGADIINDISALEDDPELGRICAERGAAVVLMHKKGIPRDMQDKPRYGDPAVEVENYLVEAAARAQAQGISGDRIVLDPGIGFGKTLADNLAVLNRLAEICSRGYPVLAGPSRKSFIGELTGKPAGERLAGTLGAVAFCFMRGASIFRVHDAKETADVLKVLGGLLKGR
jgi:dihydropteroate synthase